MTAPAQAVDFTPYSTVVPLLGTLESYLSRVEGQRQKSYAVYEQIYWNVPNTFKVVQRGSQLQPIYIPVARTVIDTVDRYVGADFGWTVDPLTAPDTEVVLAEQWFRALFVRERFLSKYDSNKLFGLIRGDWAWHIQADADKLEGTRIRILALDPGSLHKITAPDDVDRLLGYDIVEKFTDGDKVRLKVQRYTKGPDPIKEPDSKDNLIYSSLIIWDLEEFAKPLGVGKPVRFDSPPTPLPAQITALPIYHIPNFESPGDPWGSSELRGYEGVLAAVNQAISDEDLALALEGLGIYATDSGPPIDAVTKQPTNWKLGPGRVVELSANSNMQRVNGINTVGPYQDHLRFLVDSIKQASAATDAASGKVDVSIAESGISLLMQLGPMLSKAVKKDRIIKDVHAQMFHDLKMWLLAYEQVNIPVAEVVPTFGDKLPTNKSGELADILSVLAVSPALLPWGIRQIAKLGYDFTPEEIKAAVDAQIASAAQERVDAELNAQPSEVDATATEVPA